ncbi:growth factor receptor-bound protein 14 isoform X1 [Tachysurus vachellii]|nr:growth factor receptor-bound protein 14 isoform X1 [Tachysurus vachellii]XP_060732663.1 growth factor receptor-bound protein 14 isoform X1 [Tachysurus vachellii]
MSAMSDSLDALDTPCSLGEKAAIFREGKGNVSALSGGDHALITLHSPYQPPGAVHNRTASAAAALCRGNRKCRQGEEMQMNMVQNSFPDLFTSEYLLPCTKNSSTQVIKVYSEDNSSRAVEVPSDITARDICQLFILKNHCIDDHSWTLIEHLAHLGIERIIEDHESVLEVQSNWGMDSDSRLYFRKNYAKYEFFKKPLDFFPESMVSISSEANGLMNHSQLIQTFLNSSTCPEIHGFLSSKEQGRKSWKKFYFVLRRSGLYFSNKGTSKEPRHLQFVAEFCDSDVYTLLSARKTHGAPTDYGFCIKPSKSSSARDFKLLCADVEQTRTCWITAMRLFKFGMQLYQNFIQPHQKQKSSPMRSISENSLVAMDFSGQRSRVIDNPSEALSVAVEEGLSWRRKSCHRLSHGSCSPSQSSLSNIAIHMAQPWFHSKLSRDEAHKLITQHGLIDGVFLLRDSQSNPKTFVLSLCHAQRIRHFQIVPVEDDGELFYSLDDGNTRFSDLLQLVEFYQLNRGVLPCKLKHHCARTTL